MSDLTNQEKIDIMRVAVSADWDVTPEDPPESKVIDLYHAMIKAITQDNKECEETSYAHEYEVARDLAIHIWEAHYKADAPKWEPCDNLLAVLTQIDNMATGLTKAKVK